MGGSGPHAGHCDDDEAPDEYPAAMVAELRADGRLGAMAPPRPEPITTTSRTVSDLAARSPSCAMILAMHHIQVACIARHAGEDARDRVLPRVARGELLLASANSEAGLGGATRTSRCALEPDGAGDRLRLTKDATVVSYGEHADGILVTARRGPDSAPDDQVLAICLRPDLSYEATGDWDTLGLRATCSRGGRLTAELDPTMVIADYGTVFARTSLPVSVILLSSVWVGLAEAAAARALAAQRDRQRAARRSALGGDGPPPGGLAEVRLAELEVVLHQLRQTVAGVAAEYDRCKDSDEVATFGFAGRLTSAKVAASTLVLDVVQRAMAIVGLASYHRHGPYSLTDLLCDAAAAPLMISNDRALETSGDAMLVRKSL